MAGINGIRAIFNSQRIQGVMDQFQNDMEDKTLETLQFMGEKFVNNARMGQTYKDKTGNLRSSIGYMILKDGRVLQSNFDGSTIGTKKGYDVAREIASQFNEGWALIGVAGMHYAAYVEAKNFDVITGSAPTVNDIKSILNEINP